VLVLALWKFIKSLLRGGELPGLGDDDVDDELEDVSLSINKLLWLRVVDEIIWLPLRMLRIEREFINPMEAN
jgi:hypothetical protein